MKPGYGQRSTTIGHEGAPNTHPSACLPYSTTKIKLVGYLKPRHATHTKGPINRPGTVGVSIALTRVTGVYLPGKAPTEDLVEDLASIPRAGRAVMLGDFNSHHRLWGAEDTDREEALYEWASTNYLTQHISHGISPTSLRRGVGATRNLCWIWYLAYPRIGTDHDLTPGSTAAKVPTQIQNAGLGVLGHFFFYILSTHAAS